MRSLLFSEPRVLGSPDESNVHTLTVAENAAK